MNDRWCYPILTPDWSLDLVFRISGCEREYPPPAVWGCDGLGFFLLGKCIRHVLINASVASD